jgi:hypothetical protein
MIEGRSAGEALKQRRTVSTKLAGNPAGNEASSNRYSFEIRARVVMASTNVAPRLHTSAALEVP